jgi:hypothetical protein
MNDHLTRRLIFSLYCAIGFLVLSVAETLINPRIYEKLADSTKYRAYVGGNIPSDYHMGYYVYLLTLPIFLIIFFSSNIQNWFSRLGLRQNSFTNCIYVAISFFLISVIAGVANFGLISHAVGSAVFFAVVFGLIAGVQTSAIDLSFINDKDIQIQVKIAKLQSEYTKWLAGLALLTAIVIPIILATIFQPAFYWPEAVRAEALELHQSFLLYLGAGMAIGIYWNIIMKVNRVTEALTEIKETDRNASKNGSQN